MSTTTAVAAFFLIWWVTLFAVLPWGVRSQQEGSTVEVVPGTDPGAPLVPRIGRKLILTTLVAAVIFGVFYVVGTSHVVTLDDLLKPLGLQFNERY